MQPAKPAAFFLRVGIRHIGDENIKDKERIKNMDRIYGNESGISYCYDNGGVTFYCSDVYTCRDIDMASNVKRVCFGEDNNTNQMYYKLRYSCMIFPNVTEIYIARNVAVIEINNRMFPNCRKIVSNNVNYRSGSMLVKKDKAMDWNFLLNAFCLKKGEYVDLTGIDMIKSDFGTREVDGREPVIMTEFETLLVVLRRVLGEEKYNLVLQRASEEELSKDGKEISRNGEKERMAEVIKAILSGMEDK